MIIQQIHLHYIHLHYIAINFINTTTITIIKGQTSEATNAIKQNHITSLPSPSSRTPVKANSIISFNSDNINYQAKVLSRAGKASGKYKSCYNVEYLSPDHPVGQQIWIDLGNIDITSVRNKPETTKTDKIL